MANVCSSHLRIQGPPAELTRLLTRAAALTDACFSYDDFCNSAWRVMHNLFPVPADVLARPWDEAGESQVGSQAIPAGNLAPLMFFSKRSGTTTPFRC
jgi:hypothetical protein